MCALSLREVLLCCVCAIALPLSPRVIAGIPVEVRAVDKDAPGPIHDGLTWDTAFLTVQEGLAAMNPEFGIDTIWVAEGTYRPDEGAGTPGDRDLSFDLIEKVRLLGGFEGDEQDESERNPGIFVTILSGDLAPFGSIPENSLHVIRAENISFLGGETEVNGFTIKSGNASGIGTEGQGAGALLGKTPSEDSFQSALIKDCIFEVNHAAVAGGAVSHDPEVDANIRDCIFRDNVAGSGETATQIGGGAVLADEGVIFACHFEQNIAYAQGVESGGGAVFAQLANVAKCRFIDNEAVAPTGGITNGGGLFLYGGTFGGELNGALYNCEFLGNSATFTGGGAYVSGTWALMNCTFSGNSSTMGGGLGAAYVEPMVNCTFAGNHTLGCGGGEPGILRRRWTRQHRGYEG